MDLCQKGDIFFTHDNWISEVLFQGQFRNLFSFDRELFIVWRG